MENRQARGRDPTDSKRPQMLEKWHRRQSLRAQSPREESRSTKRHVFVWRRIAHALERLVFQPRRILPGKASAETSLDTSRLTTLSVFIVRENIPSRAIDSSLVLGGF